MDANPQLRNAVWSMLKGRYSPEQVSGRLRRDYLGDDTMYACPETIYQLLFFQAKRGAEERDRCGITPRS